MNKKRREQIYAVISQLKINEDRLRLILAEEENAFDSMPENLQSSLRGEESEEAIDILTDAVDDLSKIIDELYDIQ